MPGTPRNKKCALPQCDLKIDDANKAIICSICMGWFHLSCISLNKDICDIIKNDKNKNIIWKCDTCIFDIPSVGTLLNKINTLEKLVSNKFDLIMSKVDKIMPQTTPSTKENSNSKNTNDITSALQPDPQQINDDSNNNEVNLANNTQPETSLSICKYYKKGQCQHGATGKKLINGLECKFQHPSKCLKYCRYGSDSDLGCTGPCKLLHPTLCRNSFNYKSCYNPKCTFAHLAGTQRNKDWELPVRYSDEDIYSGIRTQRSLNNSRERYNKFSSRPHQLSFNNTSEQNNYPFANKYQPPYSLTRDQYGLPASNSLIHPNQFNNSEHLAHDTSNIARNQSKDYWNSNHLESILNQIQGSIQTLVTNSAPYRTHPIQIPPNDTTSLNVNNRNYQNPHPLNTQSNNVIPGNAKNFPINVPNQQ